MPFVILALLFVVGWVCYGVFSGSKAVYRDTTYRCPECHSRVYQLATRCHKCGVAMTKPLGPADLVPPPKPTEIGWGMTLAIIVGFIAVFYVIVTWMSNMH